MKKFITIAVKEPGKDWRMNVVEDVLPSYQKIVGGNIEFCHSTKSGILIFGNEEGKLRGLEPNIELPNDIIVGTVFAVRSDEEGEFETLTDEDFVELGIKGDGNGKK